MRSESERAEQTVAIGSALCVFAGLVVVTGLLTWGLHAWTGVDDDSLATFFDLGALVSGVVALVHLAWGTARR